MILLGGNGYRYLCLFIITVRQCNLYKSAMYQTKLFYAFNDLPYTSLSYSLPLLVYPVTYAVSQPLADNQSSIANTQPTGHVSRCVTTNPASKHHRELKTKVLSCVSSLLFRRLTNILKGESREKDASSAVQETSEWNLSNGKLFEIIIVLSFEFGE